MAVDNTSKVLQYVRQRLESMLDAPDMWGSPESVELQVLLLVEVGLTAMGMPEVTVNSLGDQYSRLLLTRTGKSSLSLAASLGLRNRANDEFRRVLREFVWKVYGAYQPAGVSYAPTLPARDRSDSVHLEAYSCT